MLSYFGAHTWKKPRQHLEAGSHIDFSHLYLKTHSMPCILFTDMLTPHSAH